MSEYQINERRNWKAQTFPYDYYIPDETQECQYCLTEKQAEILRGIVEPLAWDTRWWSDLGTPISKDKIEAFRDDIIRRLIMSCCGDDGILFQYSDTGVLQESDDGGLTYHDVPEKDPRNNSPRFPPMSGSDGDDKKCTAATGMVALIKEQVGDQLTDDMSRYTLNQLITDWVHTMVTTSNPFTALVTVVANQIFALIIATLRPALTSGVYDTLQCIFYCNMSPDATFTDTQWSSVRDDITAQIGGIAGIFLEHLVYLLGVAGLTNLARAAGATSGDCSSCDCGNCDLDNWVTYFGTEVSRTTDTIIVTALFNPPDGRYHAVVLVPDNAACCYVSFNRSSPGQDIGWEAIACGETTTTTNYDTRANQVSAVNWSDNVDVGNVTFTFSGEPIP